MSQQALLWVHQNTSLNLAPAELAVVEGSEPPASTLQPGKGYKTSNKA